MLVKILNAFIKSDISYVSYETSVGRGVAEWEGPTPEPETVIDVEYDLDDIFYWGTNINPSTLCVESIKTQNGATYIMAKLILEEDDTSAALLIDNSIILIELKGEIDKTPAYVELRAIKITLYPTNI